MHTVQNKKNIVHVSILYILLNAIIMSTIIYYYLKLCYT